MVRANIQIGGEVSGFADCISIFFLGSRGGSEKEVTRSLSRNGGGNGR